MALYIVMLFAFMVNETSQLNNLLSLNILTITYLSYRIDQFSTRTANMYFSASFIATAASFLLLTSATPFPQTTAAEGSGCEIVSNYTVVAGDGMPDSTELSS